MYNRKELKKSAKALLRGSVPHFMLVSLVYVLLTTGVGHVLDLLDYTGGIFSGVLSTFANILLFLFSMVMAVGLCNYALRLSRKEPTGMGSLFEGFAFTGRSLGVELLVILRLVLVFLATGALVFILGFIYIFLPSTGIVDDLFAVLMGLVYAAAVVVALLLILRYGMAAFALADDPGLGAGECLRRSKAMMRKNLGKLFWLQLSFIGWIILAALIAAIVQGIGLALLGPENLLAEIEQIFLLDDVYDLMYALEDFVYNLQYQLRWWTVLGEILALPLTLWLTVYRQAALAQFYNFASGYDYHRYMHDAPADSLDPPGGYYHSPSDGGGNQ